jgi:hypothetical protein
MKPTYLKWIKMNTPTVVALITFSALNFAATAAILTLVIVGGKKAQIELDDVKTKMTKNVRNIQSTLSTMEW